MLRQDWLLEDYEAGRLEGLAFLPELAPPTTRRILELAREKPTVLLPSHDTETPARLEERATLETPVLVH